MPKRETLIPLSGSLKDMCSQHGTPPKNWELAPRSDEGVRTSCFQRKTLRLDDAKLFEAPMKAQHLQIMSGTPGVSSSNCQSTKHHPFGSVRPGPYAPWPATSLVAKGVKHCMISVFITITTCDFVTMLSMIVPKYDHAQILTLILISIFLIFIAPILILIMFTGLGHFSGPGLMRKQEFADKEDASSAQISR